METESYWATDRWVVCSWCLPDYRTATSLWFYQHLPLKTTQGIPIPRLYLSWCRSHKELRQHIRRPVGLRIILWVHRQNQSTTATNQDLCLWLWGRTSNLRQKNLGDLGDLVVCDLEFCDSWEGSCRFYFASLSSDSKPLWYEYRFDIKLMPLLLFLIRLYSLNNQVYMTFIFRGVKCVNNVNNIPYVHSYIFLMIIEKYVPYLATRSICLPTYRLVLLIWNIYMNICIFFETICFISYLVGTSKV